MKKDTHPQWYPDAKVIVNGELVMTVGSTQPELNIEIWSGTHPFYTGQQRLVDTEGQVDRFLRRLQRRSEIQAEIEPDTADEVTSPVDAHIRVIKLAARAQEALLGAGLETVGAVLEKLQAGGDDALLAITGVGQTALINIKKYLRNEELM